MAPTTNPPPILPYGNEQSEARSLVSWCPTHRTALAHVSSQRRLLSSELRGGAGLGTPLTSAIWISSGSSRGWLGPLARLRFWWAGHMFCRRWLCICLRCFLCRERIGEPSMAPPKGRNSLAVLPGRLGNAHNPIALYCVAKFWGS